MNNKHLNVAAAAIIDKNKVFVAQRRNNGLWEFPGGKLETGESAEDALVREICEEFGAKVEITGSLGVSEYDYGSFSVSLYGFTCVLTEGTLTLKEHLCSRWVPASELMSVNFSEADIPLAEKVRNLL